MHARDFAMLLDQQYDRCTNKLVDKAREYASDDDRLHNFKISAALQDCSIRRALAGMMAKHTISIYDMLGTDSDFTLDVWDEKITDHINYLILLRAVVQEEAQDPLQF